jgi:hypothetical protein
LEIINYDCQQKENYMIESLYHPYIISNSGMGAGPAGIGHAPQFTRKKIKPIDSYQFFGIWLLSILISTPIADYMYISFQRKRDIHVVQ